MQLRDSIGRMKTFAEFWPFYLREHSKPVTRRMHFAGTTLSICFFAYALVMGRPWFYLGALLCGYAFAWVAHFFVEHNRPATFKYPFWSFGADFKMWAFALTGKLAGEFHRAGVQ